MKKTLRTAIMLMLTLACCLGLFIACGDDSYIPVGGTTYLSQLQGQYGIFIEDTTEGDPFTMNDKLITMMISEDSVTGRMISDRIGDLFDGYEELYMYDIYITRYNQKLDYNKDVFVAVPLEMAGDYTYIGAVIFENGKAGLIVPEKDKGEEGFLYFTVPQFSSVENPSYFVIARTSKKERVAFQALVNTYDSTYMFDGGYIEGTKEYIDSLADGIFVEKDSTITLKAVANEGFFFVGWYDLGKERYVATVASFEFVVSEHMSIVAYFSKIATFGFLAQAGVGGYLTENGQAVEFDGLREVVDGTKITLTAVANDGYVFKGWANNDADREIFSTEETYEFTVDKLTLVLALFETDTSKTYKFTAKVYSTGGGSITENGQTADYSNGKEFNVGTAVTLTAQADSGYEFGGWFYTATNLFISNEATCAFIINSDVDVYALFNIIQTQTYRILLKVQGNGELYDENNEPVSDMYVHGQSLAAGTEIKLTAKEFEGSKFKGWYNTEDDTLISAEATYTFKMTDHIIAYALFEEEIMYVFLAQCDSPTGGYLEENLQTVDFGNGRYVAPNTKIKLTAVANEGYMFKGWATRDADWNAIIFSTEDTYEFTVSESVVDDHGTYYVQAIFEKKADGLRIDAHNAGFTYNENGELAVTVYKIGNEIKPNIEHVGIYATYNSYMMEDKYLTLNEDYTRDLGGLDFTKAGTYTVTYTYIADPSVTISLTVQVVE